MTVGSAPPVLRAYDDDAPLDAPAPSDSGAFAATLGRALDGAAQGLLDADRTERAFAAGTGGLQEMVVARAEADVRLALTAAAASRTTQALGTIFGMQV